MVISSPAFKFKKLNNYLTNNNTMQREIKFRGQSVDNSEWVFGSYNNEPCANITFINSDNELDAVEIIPDTVGQFTGLKDKNGVDIYEGDMFNPDSNNEEIAAVIRWDNESAKFVIHSYGYACGIGEGSQEVYDSELTISETTDLADVILEYCEVIGNIHQNPELLK